MLQQMERSAIHLMAKRGKSVRQIAVEVGHSPTTIARVLREPLDRPPTKRMRQDSESLVVGSQRVRYPSPFITV